MKQSDTWPLVSIIVTSYNREKYISQAIQSALMQDYPALEIIIADNCSADSSEAIIKELLADPRIIYIRNEANVGMIRNFKKAIASAKGEYLSFISSDDYLTDPLFVSQAVSLFHKYDQVLMVKGISTGYFDETNIQEAINHRGYEKELCRGKELFWEFQNGNSLLGMDGCIISNKALRKIEISYDQDMTSLDYEINLKLSLLGDIAFIDKLSYVMRIHAGQTSKKWSVEMLLANMRMIDRVRDFAREQGPFTEKELADWYFKIITDDIRYNYMKTYLNDFVAFGKFEKAFSAQYPGVIKKINRERGVVLLKWLYNQHYNLLGILKYLRPGYYKTLATLKD